MFISSGKRRSTRRQSGGKIRPAAWVVPCMLDRPKLRMAERRQSDSERLHLLADALQSSDEDRLFGLFYRGTEARFVRNPVGIDFGARGWIVRRKPWAMITVELDLLDHGDDRVLDHLLLLGSQRVADRLQKIPSEGAMTRYIAHDEAHDLFGDRIARHLVEMTEHV